MISQLEPDLWTIDHEFSMLGIPVGTRTTLIRLADGGLFMHAPGPLEAGLADEIATLGPVRCIIAPNVFHHLYVAENAETWPEAQIFIAPGLAAKREDLNYEAELTEESSPLWAADVEQIWVRGMPHVNEVVFFHRRSRTLILADLAFNIPPAKSLRLRLFLWLNGASGGRLTPSRTMKAMCRDREMARRSIEKIFDWDFERVTMCHGEIAEGRGRERLRPGFDWLLGS